MAHDLIDRRRGNHDLRRGRSLPCLMCKWFELAAEARTHQTAATPSRSPIRGRAAERDARRRRLLAGGARNAGA
jgi:hypothetical protein